MISDLHKMLTLDNGDIVQLEKVLRYIPNRRLVAIANWQDKTVIVKLFFHKRHAKRNMEADAAGVKLLQENKVPTPAIYFQGTTADKQACILIFEYIGSALNLDEIWRTKKDVEEVLHILRAVTIELATQHVLGLLQQDLHFKNFLLTEKTIYTLDGAQITQHPMLLPKEESIKNLALFLSQLGVGFEFYQEILFRSYAKARGWLLKQEDVRDLFFTIKKWNGERWRRYSEKIFRDATDFVRVKNWRTLIMYQRQCAHPEFLAFLANPDEAFKKKNSTLLKGGRSSTVIRITLDGKNYVIKRHNMKSIWHRLRRCFRHTRAYNSWRLAQKLYLFGVPTAKPIAFIEKQRFGLRGVSYFVTEYVSGTHIADYFSHHRTDETKINAMVEKITSLLKNLAKLEITHGDLKATNILINAEEQPVLIDLDGANEHYSLSSLHKAWRKEIKRFLENFKDQPWILEKFKNDEQVQI